MKLFLCILFSTLISGCSNIRPNIAADIEYNDTVIYLNNPNEYIGPVGGYDRTTYRAIIWFRWDID